jgi:hypothetical protein
MKLKGLWRTVRPHLPAPAIDAVVHGRRTSLRIRCWYEGLRDRRRIRTFDIDQIPPAYLRYRVHGSPDLGSFLRGGERTIRDLREALESVGKDMTSFESVLDFGCGCGRTLLWFPHNGLAGQRLQGTDIDAAALQ